MSLFKNIITSQITNGLVGWWKFNEGSGTITLDSSGQKNNGTLVSSPSWVNGYIRGNALLFNGANYVSLPFGTNFTPLAMTISVWLNISSYSSNPRLIANSHTDSDGKGFQLMINNGGASGFFDVGTVNGIGSASWSSTISVSKWYHYVGTYNGSSILAYINGNLVATGSATGVILGGNNNFAIGYNPNYTGDFVTGMINNVRLYNRALSLSEIKILYNSYS